MEEVECTVDLTTQAVVAACSSDYTQVKQAESLILKLEHKPGFNPILAVSKTCWRVDRTLEIIGSTNVVNLTKYPPFSLIIHLFYSYQITPLWYDIIFIRRCRSDPTFLVTWEEWRPYVSKTGSPNSGGPCHPSKIKFR